MYKLSVIIPTKNRIEYCIAAIKSVLSLNNKDVQVVIQDNSDQSNEEIIYREFGSNQALKYHYHSGVLSFVDNFSEAVSLAEGNFLCMIGDDDAVLPNIVDALAYAEKNEYEVIIPEVNAVYCWPMEKPFVPHAENGYLVISYLKNKKKEVDCHKALCQLMKNGGQEYQRFLLPRLYHGLVRRDVMEKIKSETGKYFDGLSPDIYNAVALSLVCKKVSYVAFPFTVSGICPRSGSSDSATGKHTGKLSDAPHFRGHDSYEWDDYVPRIYSVESIWADSALRALKNFGREDIRSLFNIGYIDRLCLCKYSQFSRDIRNHMLKYEIPYFEAKIRFRLYSFGRKIKKVVLRLLRKRGDVRKYYNIPQIGEAVSIIEGLLESEKYIL